MEVERLLFAVFVVFCITFTVTYGVVRLNQWLDTRDARRRNHARKRRW